MSAPACRVCGSSHVTLRGKKRGAFLPREFSFFQCEECGFLFVEPFSGYEIYNDAYYRGAGPDPYVDYETEYRDWRRTDRGLEFEDMVRIAANWLQSSEQRAAGSEHSNTADLRASGPTRDPLPATRDSPIRWLDFGCGAGAFLKYLRERGSIAGRPLELTGHDVGSYAELLRARDGFRILDLEELSREPADSYDVIDLIEVIEHLPNPSDAIALLARLLKPGGLLLLTTGNLDGPIARRQGIHYRYCAPEIHVSLFNPRCLAQLYRQHGLEPYHVRYRGAVKFKAIKSLRYRPVLRALARAALAFPPAVRVLDSLYAVSAMPCAIKRST